MLNLSINTQGFNSFSRKVSPFLMFNNGAEGGLYPISDLKHQGKLYTDSALSTVLTSPGDPLGGADDLSGNGNALTQATDTDRPVVRQEADGNWSVEFNYTNQYLSSSYPAGTYTICLAGINGAWFDEIEHAGGAFDLGPTTFSSVNPDTDPDAPARLYGPEGILEVVGNVVAFIPMEGSISAAQKARLLQYLKQLGCPGEITLGDELRGDFEANTGATYNDSTHEGFVDRDASNPAKVWLSVSNGTYVGKVTWLEFDAVYPRDGTSTIYVESVADSSNPESRFSVQITLGEIRFIPDGGNSTRFRIDSFRKLEFPA